MFGIGKHTHNFKLDAEPFESVPRNLTLNPLRQRGESVGNQLVHARESLNGQKGDYIDGLRSRINQRILSAKYITVSSQSNNNLHLGHFRQDVDKYYTQTFKVKTDVIVLRIIGAGPI